MLLEFIDVFAKFRVFRGIFEKYVEHNDQDFCVINNYQHEFLKSEAVWKVAIIWRAIKLADANFKRRIETRSQNNVVQ